MILGEPAPEGTYYLAMLVFAQEEEDRVEEMAIPVLLFKNEETGIMELKEIFN
jgi:hypothetical protein